MSFAAFVLKLEADAKGVEKGVYTAQQHFKKLGATVKDIEKRKDESLKKDKEAARLAFERLKPEEKLNQLMRTREQLANRLARVDDPRLKNAYLQKQLELEKQITAAQTERASAGRANLIRSVTKAGVVASVVGGAAGAAISSAGNIEDIALKSNLSIDTVQRLLFAAQSTGADPNATINTFLDVQKNRSSALMGDEGAMKHFSRLGYSEGDLRKMSPEDLFYSLSDKAQNGGINSGNMAAFFGIAEQGAKEILPAMKRGLDDAARSFDGMGNSASGVIGALAGVRNMGVSLMASMKAGGMWALRGGTAGALGLGALGGAAVLNIPALLGSDWAASKRDQLLDARENMFGDPPLDVGLSEEGLTELRRGRDFQDELDWLMGGDLVSQAGSTATKKAQRNRMGGTSHIDTDPMAQIGLYIGGQAQRHQQEMQSTLKSIDRGIQNLINEVSE